MGLPEEVVGSTAETEKYKMSPEHPVLAERKCLSKDGVCQRDPGADSQWSELEQTAQPNKARIRFITQNKINTNASILI